MFEDQNLNCTQNSDCAYDHNIDHVKKRRNIYDYTGCLAHVKVTTTPSTGAILRVRGYFGHNGACQKAVIARMPELPIHPAVYVVALAQLRDGASITNVQLKNRSLFHARTYKDQPAHDQLHKCNYRWLLKQTDFRTIYRKFNCVLGINANDALQYNVHDWLNPNHTDYNPTLANAVFHYSARTSAQERFEVCIATNEM